MQAHPLFGVAPTNRGPASFLAVVFYLLGNQPFCDGSHKKTLDEQAGKVYVYNKDGTRKEVIDASRG